jgi:hypothetical protein
MRTVHSHSVNCWFFQTKMAAAGYPIRILKYKVSAAPLRGSVMINLTRPGPWCYQDFREHCLARGVSKKQLDRYFPPTMCEVLTRIHLRSTPVYPKARPVIHRCMGTRCLSSDDVCAARASTC